MKQLHVTTRGEWREWLAENHGKEEAGIWLVFYKKQTGRASLGYEESVEEALCFGWIVTAKRPETRLKRVKDSLALLDNGEKLGLK
jgi:hypothetical protein